MQKDFLFAQKHAILGPGLSFTIQFKDDENGVVKISSHFMTISTLKMKSILVGYSRE